MNYEIIKCLRKLLGSKKEKNEHQIYQIPIAISHILINLCL